MVCSQPTFIKNIITGIIFQIMFILQQTDLLVLRKGDFVKYFADKFAGTMGSMQGSHENVSLL